jgi:hypothetical protein
MLEENRKIFFLRAKYRELVSVQQRKTREKYEESFEETE